MARGGGYCEGRSQNYIPKARKPKKIKWLTKVAIYIADKRREAKKAQAHPDEVRKLNHSLFSLVTRTTESESESEIHLFDPHSMIQKK